MLHRTLCPRATGADGGRSRGCRGGPGGTSCGGECFSELCSRGTSPTIGRRCSSNTRLPRGFSATGSGWAAERAHTAICAGGGGKARSSEPSLVRMHARAMCSQPRSNWIDPNLTVRTALWNGACCLASSRYSPPSYTAAPSTEYISRTHRLLTFRCSPHHDTRRTHYLTEVADSIAVQVHVKVKSAWQGTTGIERRRRLPTLVPHGAPSSRATFVWQWCRELMCRVSQGSSGPLGM